MAYNDPLRLAARVSRRVPGYRYLRRNLVPRLRKSPAARALAHRIFAVETQGSWSHRAPSDITAGTLLGGIGVERLPVVLIVLVGTPTNRIGDIAEEVAKLQVLGAGFRPVFVIDSPTFAPIRRFGYVIELVTPRDSWAAEEPWSEYLRRRFASMLSAYGAHAVVAVGPDGLGDSGRAALEALG
jgi:hypothetical protein